MRKNPQLFNTIIIGNNTKATAVYKEIKRSHQSSAYNLPGFMNAGRFSENSISKNLPCLGSMEDLDIVIQQKRIRQSVIALKKPEQVITEDLISKISAHDMEIKIVPDMLTIVSSAVKRTTGPVCF
jgi:FlaA1/EpsC-like NDP-sugar epimerase